MPVNAPTLCPASGRSTPPGAGERLKWQEAVAWSATEDAPFAHLTAPLREHYWVERA
jgi:hypothetical protein